MRMSARGAIHGLALSLVWISVVVASASCRSDMDGATSGEVSESTALANHPRRNGETTLGTLQPKILLQGGQGAEIQVNVGPRVRPMGLAGAEAAAVGGITVQGVLGPRGRVQLRTWDLIEPYPEVEIRSDGTVFWLRNPRISIQQGREGGDARWFKAEDGRAARFVLGASRLDLVLPLLYLGRILETHDGIIASEFSTIGSSARGVRVSREEWSVLAGSEAEQSLPSSWRADEGVAISWNEDLENGGVSFLVFPCGDTPCSPDQSRSSRGWIRPSMSPGDFERPEEPEAII